MDLRVSKIVSSPEKTLLHCATCESKQATVGPTISKILRKNSVDNLYGCIDIHKEMRTIIKRNLSKNQTADQKSSRLVSETLLECIRSGNMETFREVLSSYIVSANKLRFSKKTGLGRQTLYDILDPNKGFNPALSTVTAIMRGLSE